MTVVEHLSELRRRVFVSILAVTAGALVGFIVAPTLIVLLKAPIAQPLYFTAPSSALFLQLASGQAPARWGRDFMWPASATGLRRSAR